MAEEVIVYQMKDKSGNNVAGLTPEEAVYDANGVRLNEKIESLKIKTEQITETTKEISPNTYYIFGEVETLNITLSEEKEGVLNEYMFEFTSGDTPTVLTLPETVKWIGDSLVDNNKTYQVSIVNNIAVMGGA